MHNCEADFGHMYPYDQQHTGQKITTGGILCQIMWEIREGGSGKGTMDIMRIMVHLEGIN